MSSFFKTPGGSQKKRKRQDTNASTADSKRRRRDDRPTTKSRNQRERARSESISGSESGSDDAPPAGDAPYESSSGSDNEDETAAEKRLRLAEQYLSNLRAEIDADDVPGFDAADIDRDLIAERLKEDVAENKGKAYRHIAQDLDWANATRTFFRADQRDLTAVAACAPYVYTVSKERSVIKWEMPSGPPPPPTETPAPAQDDHDNDNNKTDEPPTNSTTKPKNPKFTPPTRPKKLAFARGRPSHSKDYPAHTSAILCAAASTTGLFLATGGLDRKIVIWDVSAPSSLRPVKVFTHHRDAVTGLAFRRGTNTLYSCSKDRTVKVWSLDELAYVETLFGHQDAVADIASVWGGQEACVSVGSRDRTVRLWKVGEETQLVFRGGGVPGVKGGGMAKADSRRHWKEMDPMTYHAEGSLDRIATLDADTFVTGADCGSLSLWSVHKKKPVAVVPLAHGLDPVMPLEESYAEHDLQLSEKKEPAPPAARSITALATLPFADVVISGSWDGTLRAWKVRADKKGLDALGEIGPLAASNPDADVDMVNGTARTNGTGSTHGSQKPIEGVVNDIAILERGDRAKDGVTIVAIMGRSQRLGRWKVDKVRCTAVKFDVSKRVLHVNGAN